MAAVLPLSAVLVVFAAGLALAAVPRRGSTVHGEAAVQ